MAACVLGSLAAVAAPHRLEPAPTTLRALLHVPPVEKLVAPRSALVLVDFQDEFFHGRLQLEGAAPAVRHAADLVAWARTSGILVVNVQNVAAKPESPLFAPGSPHTAVVPELAPRPADLVIVKHLGGAFSRTDLDAELRRRGIDTLIVTGLMTHLAVNVTASDGYTLGYHVIVAGDATATRALPGVPGAEPVDARTLHRAALDALGDRVAEVLTSEALLRLPIEH